MSDWITIDGSRGEGGGQILRTALALSCVTGRPFHIDRIRAGRAKPGLLRQHLTAVQAAAAMTTAEVSGAGIGSTALSFAPSQVRPGEYHLSVGTAGSATLVLQTMLPSLLRASGRSQLTLEGGTHNPYAPPFDFIDRTFLPVLRRMNARIEAVLDRHGFYPAGGGRLQVSIQPSGALRPLRLLERGRPRVTVRALVANLPTAIAKRELAVVRERLGLDRVSCRIEEVSGSIGPGNVVVIQIDTGDLTEVVTGFGEKGVLAERVASIASDEAEAYLAADVPVGTHLADQLLIPMALAGGGAFRTLAPTSHTVTNADIVTRFLDVPIVIEHAGGPAYDVIVGPGADRGKT